MSAILDYWEVRLVNWALWKVGGSYMPMSAMDQCYDWNGCPPPPPPLVGEALDTDDLVLKLNEERQMALRITYVWTGDLTLKVQQSGIHRNTLLDRVKQAKYRLDDMDRELKRQINNATRHVRECAPA